MSLKDVVAKAKSNRKTDHTSGKTPAFYAKQKQDCIDEACQSPVNEVRIHMAGSQFNPNSNLKDMLKIEQEKDVLSALMQNDRVPIKSLEVFLDTELSNQFTEEDEAYRFIQERFGVEETAE